MTEFNSCAGLIDDVETVAELELMFAKSKDPFQEILDMQHRLQNTLAEKLPYQNIPPLEVKTKGQLITWIDTNFDAILDEFRELKTSVGGMSRGSKVASAVWKKWKVNYTEFQAENIADMSKSDHLEMLFEMIDIVHFIASIMIAMRINSKDLYVLYMLKNLENIRRYNNKV